MAILEATMKLTLFDNYTIFDFSVIIWISQIYFFKCSKILL